VSDNQQVAELGASEGEPRRLCPKCQSARVYRSHRRGRWEGLQSWLGYYPFRCRACDYRFTAKSKTAKNAGVKDPRPDLRKRQVRRMVRHILVAGICVMLFLLFLYYLAQPGRLGGDEP
jgi:hypothetical protein